MSKNKEANLCRHLSVAAQNFPNDLAVAVQQKSFNKLVYKELTFKALDQRSDHIAYVLTKQGLKAGDKAVLMITPSLDFFSITFALFKAGIIPILVDPGMGIKNLKQCFIEAQPTAFIGINKAHVARILYDWGKDTLKYYFSVAPFDLFGIQSIPSLLKKNILQHPFKMEKLNKHAMAAILFTSGSTGNPKGVIYSHAMFETQIDILRNDYHIQHGERDLATFPLFSLFGPALGMASIIPLMDASKPIKANPNNLFAAIEKYQCTNLFANPALIERLGKAGCMQNIVLDSLRRVISAGAPASVDSLQQFSRILNKGTEIISSYGATESLPITKISSAKLLQTEKHTQNGSGICVGFPIKNTTLSIIKITEKPIKDWQDNLCLAPYSIGEIVVKGTQVSQAYYQRPEATLLAKIEDNGDIRHRMGDLGYLDNQGNLWMCGRKAHRVKSDYNNQNKCYFSIPCERIFNTHKDIKRSALVSINVRGKTKALLCVELKHPKCKDTLRLFNELSAIAEQHQTTQGIYHFLIHKDFPMDIRHNAKIFREKLALWAQLKYSKQHQDN
ncbi:olefin beta-lactone synthetase [Psychromonas sp. CD1]|uniref:olefin beta-lactone synthetase n=1 Tax=Psychromonas sp. CD1 TaxID=1979839 RepID=UPI000B9AC6D6|nr:fatty acid CoA ligase family protein [Psychromonas sp. CD1]